MLKRLALVKCKALATSCLAAVGRYTELDALHLELKTPCDAKSLARLAGLTRLRELTVEVKDAAAAACVAKLGSLVKLDIKGEIEDGWEALSQGLPRLRELKARLWSEEEVAALANFPELESLDLNDYDMHEPLESSELLPLGSLSGLRRLTLRAENPDASTLESLSRLQRLEHLWVRLYNHPPDPEEWAVLKRLPRLSSLDADCPPEVLAALRVSLPLCTFHVEPSVDDVDPD
jgi:hypothetical protein